MEANQAVANNVQQAVVNHKTPSLGPFNHENPKLWLELAEMAFTISGEYTDEQKNYFVLSTLPSPLVNDVYDFIKRDADNRPSYIDLKNFIIQHTSIPTQEKIKQLLNDAYLGDRKPTQFLRHLKDLVGNPNDANSDIVRSIFLQRLPVNISMIIAPHPNLTLDQLAIMADNIQSQMDCSRPTAMANRKSERRHDFNADDIFDLTASINSLKLETQNTADTNKQLITAMQNQLTNFITTANNAISELKREVDYLRERNRFSRSRSRDRSFSRDRTQQSQNGLCFYHNRFGNNARACQNPCNFYNQSNNQNVPMAQNIQKN